MFYNIISSKIFENVLGKKLYIKLVIENKVPLIKRFPRSVRSKIYELVYSVFYELCNTLNLSVDKRSIVVYG